MLKKISFIIILLVVTALLWVPAFAEPEDGKTEKTSAVEKIVDPEEEFRQRLKEEGVKDLIAITRPESNDEKTFSKEFKISGTVNRENLIIKLFNQKGEVIKDIKGNTTWKAGESGFFSITVNLTEGYKSTSTTNVFIVYACNEDEKECFTFKTITVIYNSVDESKMKFGTKDFSLDKILKPLK